STGELSIMLVERGDRAARVPRCDRAPCAVEESYLLSERRLRRPRGGAPRTLRLRRSPPSGSRLLPGRRPRAIVFNAPRRRLASIRALPCSPRSSGPPKSAPPATPIASQAKTSTTHFASPYACESCPPDAAFVPPPSVPAPTTAIARSSAPSGGPSFFAELTS